MCVHKVSTWNWSRIYTCSSRWNKGWYASIYKELKMKMDCLTFTESFQVQISVLHQCIFIFKAGLSRLYDGLSKRKKQYLMCQIPVKMVKQHAIAIPKSSLQNLKIYSSKGCRKTSQRFMYVCSHGCEANTAIIELRIFSGRYHFR